MIIDHLCGIADDTICSIAMSINFTSNIFQGYLVQCILLMTNYRSAYQHSLFKYICVRLYHYNIDSTIKVQQVKKSIIFIITGQVKKSTIFTRQVKDSEIITGQVKNSIIFTGQVIHVVKDAQRDAKNRIDLGKVVRIEC